ncbi:MAG: L-alanine-DL-glutamate epimerase [Cyclobacteriaceae bacterium]|nr:L-alanine-DL-glutamate epimerase [Cyclobacteriaceae bacterium]
MESKYNRRSFVKNLGLITGLGLTAGSSFAKNGRPSGQKINKIRIQKVSSNFEREPLVRPFGFKGGFMTEIWQTASFMESSEGTRKIGLCTQNVLWSDAQVFTDHSESGGNALMYAMTERAMQMVKGESFENPVELLDNMLDELYSYGKKICRNDQLRMTFALNALVGLDNAAWLIYAQENNLTSFDAMIPEAYKPALSTKHDYVASIPLMAYNIPIQEIKDAVDQGYFFMKIKIGQPGTQKEMLEKDMERISAIHKAIGASKTRFSENGKLPYYFDANGRYESKDALMRLIDHIRKIGAFDQIAIIEEPFPEEMHIDVRDIPVRLAADESAHTDKDAKERIEMGYASIALKAIAKTLSMTMKIAQVAHEANVPCFCADLTVNPQLIEWNKNVAARLAPFPGLGLGLLETNGHQNYKNWNQMKGYHNFTDAPWAQTKNGVFQLDKDYYQRSGGIFEESEHYNNMFSKV